MIASQSNPSQADQNAQAELLEEEDDQQTPEPRARVSLRKIYQVFGRHYKKYWKVLAFAYASLLVTIGVEVLSPWPLMLILDQIVLQKPLPEKVSFLSPLFTQSPQFALLLLALAIVVFALLEALFSYFNKFWVSSTGDRMNADIRERVFGHLQRLSLSFHEKSRSGNVVYLLTQDVGEMKGILMDFPQDFLRSLLSFASYLSLMLFLEWRLGLIACCVAPVIYWVTRVLSKRLKKAMRKRRERESNVASTLIENVGAMALVQAYGREETEHERFRSIIQRSNDAQIGAMRANRLFGRIIDAAVIAGSATILYVGGRFALSGEITPGVLVLFVSYLRAIFGAFEKFSGLFIGLAQARVSAERLLELVENDMVMQDAPDAVAAPPFRGRVEFKDVSFAYKPGRNVLQNLGVVMAPGETVALVGHSGAGKSTLISLLMRFYDPQQGQILIDGHDLRGLKLKSLRDQLTIVLQEAMLFRQTVRENIAFGKLEASEEEIIAAARLAEAHDFIMEMPEGYDTIINEGGSNLSGGQKQRISIARAIIRNTPIVILDEPVTGLDAKAESKINAAIQRLARHKTTFIIAHKFATIANADKILLLEEGRPSHYGTHEQLLAESAQYRELYELQFGWQKKWGKSEEAANGKLAANFESVEN